MIVNAKGEKRVLATNTQGDFVGIAWTPDDREIWFTPSGSGSRSLDAVDMRGRVRTVLRLPENVFLQDIGSDGDALLELLDFRKEMAISRAGERDRDFSWFDRTIVLDVTRDGKQILFTESGAAEHERAAAYLRRADGSPAIRLADGYAERLSPSGDAALVYLRGTPPRQTIVPAGAGSIVTLPTPPSVLDYNGIDWFPDGKNIIFSANERGGKSRLFVQRLDSNVATPITPLGVAYSLACKCLSPDGRFVVASDQQGHFNLYPVSGGASRRLPDLGEKILPAQWTTDGKSMIVYDYLVVPSSIQKYDIATGERTAVTTLRPPDVAGFRNLECVRASEDLRTFVYSFRRDLSRLVLAHGLK